MKQPKFQKSMIAAAVATLLGSPMALAQQSEEAEVDEGKLERIEVTARRTNGYKKCQWQSRLLVKVTWNVMASGTLPSCSTKCRIPHSR